jgi:hypothetical protein
MAGILGGCHAARVLAPPPPLRAASANNFAVDVEFAEPLDRTSAEDASHYQVYPAGNPAAAVPIYSATVIDTTFGRVVQLLLSGGPLPDTSQYEVRTSDVAALDLHSTRTRSAPFRTGLSYGSPLCAVFASHCDRCHGAVQASGNYRTDSYLALTGNGTDGAPNLIAGDPTCLIIRRSRPLRTMFELGGLSYLDFEILLNWVVSYGARP